MTHTNPHPFGGARSHTPLARLALETWRASGARTPERLRALVSHFATSYFGPAAQRPTEIMELVARAQHEAHSAIRAWEVQR